MSKNKSIKTISCLVITALAFILGIIFLQQTRPAPIKAVDSGIIISNREINDIKGIKISNSYGDYEILTDSGGFIVHDLPTENVNGDYLKMLLEESSAISFITEIADSDNKLSDYGYSNPSAVVNISYTDGQSLTLLIGDREPISKNRYAFVEGNEKTFLIKSSKTVRFLSPVEVFIEYMIVPFPQTSSPFNAIGDITFSGSMLEKPIVITAVEDEVDAREVISFGAATHLIRAPIFNEVDQGYSLDIFTAFSGIINEGIESYNATDQELLSYGFDTPLLQVNYQYRLSNDSPYTSIELRIVETDDGFLLVRDDQRIVHKLAQTDLFDRIDAKKMSLRWFLTPLLTDISSVIVDFSGEEYNFQLSGDDNKSLAVKLNGAEVNSELFRKYYVLLVSAERISDSATDDELIKGGELARITFSYRDEQKPDDTMVLYSGAVRRLVVEVNGEANFIMSENYYSTLKKASEMMEEQSDFDQNWQ